MINAIPQRRVGITVCERTSVAIFLGTLTNEELARAQSHVQQCAECQKRLEALERGTRWLKNP